MTEGFQAQLEAITPVVYIDTFRPVDQAMADFGRRDPQFSGDYSGNPLWQALPASKAGQVPGPTIAFRAPTAAYWTRQ